MRVARSGAVLGIFSTRGSAQAVRRRRHQLYGHEARANSARICVRSSLCRRRVQVGGIAAAGTAKPWLEPERSAARERSPSPAKARVRSSHRRPLPCASRMRLVDARGPSFERMRIDPIRVMAGHRVMAGLLIGSIADVLVRLPGTVFNCYWNAHSLTRSSKLVGQRRWMLEDRE